MDVKKQLCSVVRMALPVLGFAVICVGSYLMPLQSSEPNNYTHIILTYVLIACGFLAMLTGVLWTMCHGMKSKMYHRGRQNHRGRVVEEDQHVHVYTIDRPSCFPPSYEESEQRHVDPDRAHDSVVAVVSEKGVRMSPAPPLYTQNSSEIPDCILCWEQPPPYSHTHTVPQIHTDAEEQQEAASRHCSAGSDDLD